MEAKMLVGKEVVLTETPLVQDIIDSCRERADCIFMEDVKTKKKITFGECISNAGGISSILRTLKQKPGNIVTIISDISIECITFVYGTWLSGAATSSINPSLPTDELRSFINICKSEVIYCGPEYVDKVRKAVDGLDWATTIISPGGKRPLLDFFACVQKDNKQGLQRENWWSDRDHRIAVMFTSGTTGTPKGVVLRDETMKFNCKMQKTWTETSITLQTTPMYWISNVMGISIAACNGCKLLIANKMSLEQLLKTIEVYKVTEWFTGPAILIEMCQLKNLEQYDTSSIKMLALGGSILLPEHRKLIVQKVLGNRNIIRVMYGSTEAGMVTYDRDIVGMDTPQYASIGQVADGVTLKIVDTQTGNIQPPYIPGEVCVKSPSVLKQYINKTITEDELDNDGFWHMGDLAYYDEEGYVYYKSRLKDVMKYRGQQIAPAEIEMIIQKHPDVIESCVVGKPCVEQGGDLPTAFVVKKPDSTVTEKQLYDFVAGYVIDEKKLRGGVYFVSSLPKSAVGKVLRHVLQKRITS